MEGYYESERALGEYLLFHYGTDEEVMPYDFGPREALGFPVRCVNECVAFERLGSESRALDLGCAVGRSTLELARHCPSVIGVDYSQQFIDAAQAILRDGSLRFLFVEEGDILRESRATIPHGVDARRISFRHGDAMALPDALGQFDVVLMANLIDRLSDPLACLRRLPGLVGSGGQLVVTSPYTWLEACTPRGNWLGGIPSEQGGLRTMDALRQALAPHFDLVTRKDLPFLIREHARKFQWSVAEATVWVRR